MRTPRQGQTGYRQARALFDYDVGDRQDKLAMKKGDLIVLSSANDDSWWYGWVKSQVKTKIYFQFHYCFY